MTNDFIITSIKRVILVGKNEYPDDKTVFHADLRSNELILHLNGEATVSFDGREFARATAVYTQDELNRQQTRDSRKRGKV